MQAEETSTANNFSDKEYITLVSAENFEFKISKKAASQSKYLLQYLSGDYMTSNSIKLSDISTDVLEIICQFLVQKSIKGEFMGKFNPLKELNPENEEHRQIVIELILATNYLEC